MDNKNIKVLIIDDEADFRAILALWLKTKGYAVTCSSSGSNIANLIREAAPDILFLDLNMPVMDGVGVLGIVRKIDKELPVIMLSAHVDDKRMEAAKGCGISGIIYKGMEFSEITAVLEPVLRTHKKLKNKGSSQG